MAAPTAVLQSAGKDGIGPRRRRGCSEGIEEAPEMDWSPRGAGRTGENQGLTLPPTGWLKRRSQRRRRKEDGKEDGGGEGCPGVRTPEERHWEGEREEERVMLGGQAQPEGEIVRGTAGASEGPPEGAEPVQTRWWTHQATSGTKLFRGPHQVSSVLFL